MAKSSKPAKGTEPLSGIEPSEGSEVPFPDWLRGQLRFGHADDTIIVFVPSHARDKTPLPDQDVWASKALELLGKLYGGATGFKELRGIWRDDDNGGQLLDDQPIMIQSLAKRVDIENAAKLEELAAFLKLMGKKTKQGAIAVVFNDAMHFVQKYE